jgi:TP901 family phage tail tape measure protein
MAKSFTISMILKATNQMTAPIGAAIKSLDAMGQKVASVGASLKKLGKEWSDRGEKMMKESWKGVAAVGLPLAGAAKLAATWEDSLAKISTMTTMTTAQVRKKWQKDFFAISRETGADLDDIGEAAYQALSAAVPEDKLVEFLRVAVMASKVGFTSTTMAVDGMTSAMNAFGISAENAGNLMMAAQIKGKTTIGEISQNIGQLGPIAANMGMSFQEVMSALAGMTQTGSKTEQAMTGIRSILVATAKQTDQQQAALKKLGIEFNVNTIKQFGFIKALQIVDKAARAQTKTDAEYVAVLNDVFGRVEGLNAAFALTGGKGLAVYKDAMKMATTDTQLMVRAQEQMGGKSSTAFKKMKNEMKILSIELGTELLPYVNDLLQGFVGMVRAIAGVIKNSKPLRYALIGLIGLFVAVKVVAFAAGAAMAFAGTVMQATSALFSPTGLIIAGIAIIIAGIVLLVLHWDKVKRAVQAFGSAVLEALRGTRIGRALIWLYEQLVIITTWFYDVGTKIAVEIGRGIKDGVTQAMDWVSNKLDNLDDWLNDNNTGSKWWSAQMPTMANVAMPMAPSPVIPGSPGGSVAVDMSGMTINATDGTDVGKKIWGVLKPNFEQQQKTAKQNQARTKMED